MKSSIHSMTLVGSVLVASFAASAFAQDASVATEKKADQVSTESFSSVIPEGQTLPKGVLRARIKSQGSLNGSHVSYDKDGKKVDNMKEHNSTYSALALAYGLTNSLSLEVAAPFVHRNEADVKTPFGTKKVDGETGLSDIEAGLMYNIIGTKDLFVSAAVGVRAPTGRYADVDQMSSIQSGRGAYDAGLRLNLDYQVVEGLWTSVQHQEEMELDSVKNTKADTRFQKKGFTRKSFVQLAYGLGALHQSMKAFSVKSRYAYEKDAEVRSQKTGEVTSKAARAHKLGFGAGIDGRGYNVPVSLEGMYFTPVGGRDTTLTRDVQVTLSTYVQI